MPAPEQQQQKPPSAPVKASLSNGDAEAVAKLTRREGWKEFTVDDVLMAWDQFPDGTATQILAAEYRLADFKRFIRLAAAKGLDPLLNDLHYEFRNDKNSPTGMKGTAICHQSSDLKIAHRSGLLDGIEQKDATDERGFYVQTFVYKKGCSRPFTFKAYLREFKPSNAYDGSPWSRMEFNMTAKCSRAGCLRIAFPEELGGMVTEDEMDYDQSRNGSQQPTAPPQGLTVGEKLPATETLVIRPTVGIEPAKPQANIPPATQAPLAPAAATQTPTPAPTAPPPDDKDAARAQYKNRLAVLIGTDSAFAKAGLNKSHIDNFLLGYFGVDSKAKLPPDPGRYLAVFDDLFAHLGQDVGNVQMLIANPAKFGEFRLLAMQARPAAGFAPELSKRFGWDLALSSLGAKFMAKVGFTTVDDFKNDVLDPSGLSQMTQPQIGTGLIFAYYDAEALGLVIQANKRGMPLSQIWAETEKIAGPLEPLTVDPAKVLAAVKTVTAAKEKK
jgi:hypothetical protein